LTFSEKKIILSAIFGWRKERSFQLELD